MKLALHVPVPGNTSSARCQGPLKFPGALAVKLGHMQLSLPAGTKLRFYRITNIYSDETEPNDPGPDKPFLYASRFEFIGWPVAVGEGEEPPRLYADLEGYLYFCYGTEQKVGDWDLHVQIDGSCEEYGRTRAEILEKLRHFWVGGYEIPPLLEPPPPEPEDMHTMTGWNS